MIPKIITNKIIRIFSCFSSVLEKILTSTHRLGIEQIMPMRNPHHLQSF